MRLQFCLPAGFKISREEEKRVLVRKSRNFDVLRVYIEGERRRQVEVIKDAPGKTRA